MPFIPLNLDDAQESKPVPLGRYDVVVASCEEVPTKKDPSKTQFKMMLTIDGHEDAAPIFHYQGIPTENDFKALLMRRFLTLFGVKYDPAGFDPELLAMELIGARAKVELRTKEYEGTINNEMIIPPLKGEEGPQNAGKGAGKPPKRA